MDEGLRVEIMESVAKIYHSHSLGTVRAEFSAQGLRSLHLANVLDVSEAGDLGDASPWGCAMTEALARYFTGIPEAFTGIPLDLSGATAFQREVWAAAQTVEWGRTSTYGALAEKLGRNKGSARAVGHALGANPIAIIIPCHRFLAANGDLVNFAAGLHWKRELLRLEGSLLS